MAEDDRYDTAAAVVARAEHLNRIAALARRDVEQYAAACSGPGRPVLEPPWIVRRRKEREMEAIPERSSEQEGSVQQVISMAIGMGQQVGAMQRQLEEQNRQLKALAVGHGAQNSIQQQLLSLLNKVQPKKQMSRKQACKRQASPRLPAKLPRSYPARGPTPEEFHTLTWLNSHRQAGKHERPAVRGFRQLRRSSIQSEHRYESGSDRTRTTFGGTRKHFRSAPSQRSTVSLPTERSTGLESSRNRVGGLDDARKQHGSEQTKRVPIVAKLYAKCKRKLHKKPRRKAEKTVAQEPPIVKPVMNVPKQAAAACPERKQGVETGTASAVGKPEDHGLEDSILDSMLAVHKYEDELKLRWLVPDKPEPEGREIHKSILDELKNQNNARLNPNPMELVEEEQRGSALQPNQGEDVSKRIERIERFCRLVETLMDDLTKEICGEVLSFADDFVEHIYMSEFLNME